MSCGVWAVRDVGRNSLSYVYCPCTMMWCAHWRRIDYLWPHERARGFGGMNHIYIIYICCVPQLRLLHGQLRASQLRTSHLRGWYQRISNSRILISRGLSVEDPSNEPQKPQMIMVHKLRWATVIARVPHARLVPERDTARVWWAGACQSLILHSFVFCDEVTVRTCVCVCVKCERTTAHLTQSAETRAG